MAQQPKRRSKAGETVEVVFYAIDPDRNYPDTASFVSVQINQSDSWTKVATDRDWATKTRWLPNEDDPETYLLHVTWDVPLDTPGGEHRIEYTDGDVNGATRTFNIRSRK